ncbi:MAG: hypothetical protein LBG95_00380 [Treponema sp.]|jgi:hypothetical protein|nr:hypothetical protein [Treponema sp.]
MTRYFYEFIDDDTVKIWLPADVDALKMDVLPDEYIAERNVYYRKDIGYWPEY